MEQLDRDYIIAKVTKYIEFHFDMDSFCDMIDSNAGLNDNQKQWAKEHLSWKVYED